MKTGVQYRAELAELRPYIIIDGKRIDNPNDDPWLSLGINVISVTYDEAVKPENEPLLTATSHLTGERINRFTHIHQSCDDLLRKLAMTRFYTQMTGGCIQRCMGADGLNSVSIISHEIDQSRGTRYHQYFLDYLRYVQKEDLTLAGCVTDVKGDRSLKPHQQADPDLNLHVVEKRKDGIIVRGGKIHISIAPHCHELLVIPTQFRPKESADWAVTFAVPANAKGLKFIVNKGPVPETGTISCPITSKYNVNEALVVFDDVFVPWERVFMCGEWEWSGILARLFGDYHRHSYCGCKPGLADLFMGASALTAEYQGITKAGHIQEKLFHLIYNAEMIYSCGVASSVMGKKQQSGTYLPQVTMANMGKYHAGVCIHDEVATVQDIAGGLAFTVPQDANYQHPEAGTYIEKYLKGVASIPTEHRLRSFHLCRDLCNSEAANFNMTVGVIGAGPMEAQVITVMKDYDLEARKVMAKGLAGIPQPDDIWAEVRKTMIDTLARHNSTEMEPPLLEKETGHAKAAEKQRL